MDICENLKFNIFVFKIFGFWNKNNSLWKHFFFIAVCVLFPISLAIVVPYVDTLDTLLDHLLNTVSLFMVSIKAFNVIVRQKEFEELFQSMDSINQSVNHVEFNSFYQQTKNLGHKIVKGFLTFYAMTWMNLVVETIFSSPEERIWSSTYLIPIDVLHQPIIYYGILLYQGVSNILMALICATVDTYAIIFMRGLECAIDIVRLRLRSMHFTRKHEFIDICEDLKRIYS